MFFELLVNHEINKQLLSKHYLLLVKHEIPVVIIVLKPLVNRYQLATVTT